MVGRVLVMVMYLFLSGDRLVSGKTVEDITIEPDYGYESNGKITITVTRATVTNKKLTFKFKTLNNDALNTATTGVDYTSVSKTATIKKNKASTKINILIPTENPPVEDRGEKFRIQLNQFSDGNSRIRDRIYIIDDSGMYWVKLIQNIHIGDAFTESDVDFQCPESIEVVEIDGAIEFNLSRSSVDKHGPMTVLVSTADGTALDGKDFVGITDEEMEFANYETQKAVNVAITEDDIHEDENKTFTVLVRGDRVTPCNITVNIVDDDDLDLQCPENNWGVERDGTIEFILRRSSDESHVPTTVLVSTADGTALDGEDFVGITDEETEFAVGETQTAVNIELIDDDIHEDENKTFTVLVRGYRVTPCNITVNIVDDDKPDPFHCNRGTSQLCYNSGTCNTVSGECECPELYEGPNCLVNTSNTCTVGEDICENGFCQKDDMGQVFCICEEGWTGETCTYLAYTLQCNQNSFGICIGQYDIETFNGLVYVYGKSDVDACVLERVSPPVTNPNIPEWCRGYFLDLPYNGTDCGDFGPTYEGSVATFTAQVIVQYSTFGTFSTDELFTAFCTLDQNSVVFNTSVEVDAASKYLKKQTSVTQFIPVVMTLAKPNDQPLGEVVAYGDSIKVCVSVEQAFAWNCIVIRDIIINNARAGDNLIVEYIFENGCLDSHFQSMYVWPPAWESGTTERACFTIVPVVFPVDRGLSQVKMSVGVSYSIFPPSVTCQELTCSGRKRRSASKGEEEDEMEEEEGFEEMVVEGKRRRRSASNGEEEGFEEMVVEIVMIAPPTTVSGFNTNQQGSGDASISTLAESSSKLPLVIGGTLGGCLLIAIVVAVVVHRRRKKQTKAPSYFY